MDPIRVETRVDASITTAGTASSDPEDARSLHEWPSELPTPEGEPVTVAVMDSGIHPDLVDDHPWFEDATVGKRYDATGDGEGDDTLGHGSGVASIIARHTPEVEFYSVRIFGESGRTGYSVIADAYMWLIDHADEIDVVNMSWGSTEDDPDINRLHDMLLESGIHDVVAAGNTGSDGGSPATDTKAFSAGAVDANGDMTRFSSRDPNLDNPDVSALGADVKMARAPGTDMGTALDDEFVKGSGTSFAAPHLTAAYVNALYNSERSWDRRFEKAATEIPGSRADGDGLLKLSSALDGETDGSGETADARVWSFAGNDSVYLDTDWLEDGEWTATLIEEDKDTVEVRFER